MSLAVLKEHLHSKRTKNGLVCLLAGHVLCTHMNMFMILKR